MTHYYKIARFGSQVILMPTWKEKFTFIFVPHSSSQKTFSISFKWLTAVSILAFLLIAGGVTIFLASVGVLSNPYRVSRQFSEYEQKLAQLEEKNEELQRQQRYIDALQKNIEQIDQRQQSLAELTGLDFLQEEISELDGEGPTDIKQLSSHIQTASEQSEQLKEIKEFVKNRSHIIQNTPMMWPTQGWISSGYGYRQDPMGGRGRSFHEGVDIAAYSGTPVWATADGEVSFSGRRTGYGETVMINHEFGYETLYAHLRERHVTAGEEVKKGDLIGYVGRTGRATGSHLHYEIMVNDETLNPEPYLVESRRDF